MTRATVGDLELAYETLGEPGDPPVLLVMGLGAQYHHWPDGLCEELVQRGLRVIRYDNRDVGESTHLPGAVYTLNDMAADAVGLTRALGIDSAHMIGMSLGGMIVQLAAIEHPERVRSLTSISSTTSDPQVGQPSEEALAALLAPPPMTRAHVGEAAVRLADVIGSPGFERDDAWLRWSAEHAYDRGFDPLGTRRQLNAAVHAADRTERLRRVRATALIVHGSADPIVALSGGQATADAIPGAELLVVDDMGHDLPRGIWPRLPNAISRTVRTAESRRARKATS
jgi:pimeloyl-ACP methyl ester carboxylesterase